MARAIRLVAAALLFLGVGSAQPAPRWKEPALSHTEQHVRLLATFTDVPATQLAYAADGVHWAAAGVGELTWFAREKVVRVLLPTAAPVGALQFSRDGHRVSWGAFSFSLDGDAHETRSDEIARRLLSSALGDAPVVEFSDAATTADGDALVVAGHTRPALDVRRTATATQKAVVLRIVGETSRTLWAGPIVGAPERIAVDRQQVLLAGAKIMLLDGNTVRFEQPNPHVGRVNAIVFANDEIFTAGADGSVAALTANGDVVWKVKIAGDPLRALVVDGGLLFVAGWDDRLHWLDAANGTTLGSIALGAHGEALCVSPDHARLLVGLSGTTPEARIYELLH